jgi:predicted phosphodiesterase
VRIAILSDIHGNRTALEAVLDDLRKTSPDAVFHGGDLSDTGSSPAYVLDCIRDRGWQGVMGNTDEMLVQPDTLEDFARQSKGPPALWNAILEIAEATRSTLGEDRLRWLRSLPKIYLSAAFALVHATPESCWRVHSPNATDEELCETYGSFHRPLVVYAHTHQPSIRRIPSGDLLLINTGSVGLPYDGDPRASYLLLEDNVPSIRRVEYDTGEELKALSLSGLPHAEWVARILRTATPQLP